MMTEVQSRQKIAVVGSGISGLTSAYLLSKHHEVHLFEANDYLGGHTHTKHVERGGKSYPVNTGFIVYNNWTYPNFIKLMEKLGVESQDSDMSFSVHCDNTGLEYNGTNMNGLFAQRINLLRPRFLRMIWDILRFNKQTVDELNKGHIDKTMSLGEFIERYGYSKGFRNHYIIPMGAAIWSASTDVMMSFPLEFFLRFFNNHGMLSVDDRPVWRVLKGGSVSYVEPLCEPFKDRIHLNTPIKRVTRDQGVTIETMAGETLNFDQVVLACHSDQALAMLSDPSDKEQDILSSIPYQDNVVTLHTDERMMPRNKRAWASWNYHIPQRRTEHAMLTYNMNMLQSFDGPETFLVTLNRENEIDPEKIIETYHYAHPVFTHDGIVAQERHSEISGVNRTHYCGAYWRNGFHEDGVVSALRVAKLFGIEL